MPVIVNEFEVIEQPALQRAGNEAAPPPEGEPALRIEPPDLRPALRELEVQALRAWAH